MKKIFALMLLIIAVFLMGCIELPPQTTPYADFECEGLARGQCNVNPNCLCCVLS